MMVDSKISHIYLEWYHILIYDSGLNYDVCAFVQYADGVINVINLSILHLFCSDIIDQNVCNMMVDLRVSYIYIAHAPHYPLGPF